MDFNVGIFEDVSGKLIRETKAWSKSSLDKVDRSMAHYFESKLNPKPPTDTMSVGKAFHSAILTPDRFDREVAVYPEVNKRTNAGKTALEQFMNSHANFDTIISKGQYDDVKRMAESVMNHPFARDLLTGGQPEMAMFWIDPTTGLPCKGKSDYIRNEGVVVELKKTTDARSDAFQKKIGEQRYHVQGSFYLDGYNTITQKNATDYYFIVVEDSAPWNVAIYKLGPQSLDAGRSEYLFDLNRVLEYETAKEEERWAGYDLETPTIELKPWALKTSMLKQIKFEGAGE